MRINEALGVPEGITRESRRITSDILKNLETLNIDGEFVLLGKWDVKFGDFEIIGLPIILKISLDKFIRKPVLTGASYGNIGTWDEVGGKLHLKHNIPTSYITIDVSSKSIDSQEIKDCLKSELKSRLVSHELHHLYEAAKSGKRPLKGITNYRSYQISDFPQIIAEFLHLLYYVTTIENFVRPSEMLTMMEEEGVTKKDFTDWIKTTEMMSMMEEARTFSIQKFLEDASKDPWVKMMLSRSKGSGFVSTGDDKKDIMKIIFINIANFGSEVGSELLNNYYTGVNQKSRSIFSSLLGIEPSEVKKAREVCDKEFNNIIKFYNKWEGREEKYFDFLQKRINFAGDKMKKKISKLWAHINESNSGSILNWDLWTKTMGSSRPIKTKLDLGKIKDDFKKGLK